MGLLRLQRWCRVTTTTAAINLRRLSVPFLRLMPKTHQGTWRSSDKVLYSRSGYIGRKIINFEHSLVCSGSRCVDLILSLCVCIVNSWLGLFFGIHLGVVECHYAATLVIMLRLVDLVKFETLLGFVGLLHIVSNVVNVAKITG